MDKGAGVKGEDVPIEKLVPLHERKARSIGYNKILSSIKSIGLIEPLCVYQEGDRFVILDGFLRYRACRELGIPVVPCLVLPTKEAYTCNRMVNHLSQVQEHRMLRQSLTTIDEATIAKTLGLVTIKHRLKDNLLKRLHPAVIEAFDKKNLSLRMCAEDLIFVKPQYQAVILKEMQQAGDFSPAFVRTLILRAPDDMRVENGRRTTPWNRAPRQRATLTAKMDEAVRGYDFYAGLYRQYVSDLLTLCIYVRRLIGNKRVAAHMKSSHPELLERFQEIVFDTEGKKAT